MAGDALAVFHRLMFHLGGRNLLLHVIVTVQTKLATGLEQQLLIFRLMRVVAGGALAVLDRLVFYFGFGELLLDIIMAFGA